MNVIYHDGHYFLYQPGHSQSRFNTVESNLWLIARYTDGNRIKLREGSVARFGRIPFKVTRLKLELTEEEETDGPGLILRQEKALKMGRSASSPLPS